jgi:hypothetical protein
MHDPVGLTAKNKNLFKVQSYDKERLKQDKSFFEEIASDIFYDQFLNNKR